MQYKIKTAQESVLKRVSLMSLASTSQSVIWQLDSTYLIIIPFGHYLYYFWMCYVFLQFLGSIFIRKIFFSFIMAFLQAWTYEVNFMVVPEGQQYFFEHHLFREGPGSCLGHRMLGRRAPGCLWSVYCVSDESISIYVPFTYPFIKKSFKIK